MGTSKGCDSSRSRWSRVLLRVLRVLVSVKHVAFIMDGNRRYARHMGLAVEEGHRSGFTKLLENYQRSEIEVSNLMSLAANTVLTESTLGNLASFRLRFYGDFRFLMKEVRDKFNEIESDSEKRYQMSRTEEDKSDVLINLCVSYGARNEISTAVERVSMDAAEDEREKAKKFYKHLVAGDECPPQVLIRTSGVTRLSDFLVYQLFLQGDAADLSLYRRCFYKGSRHVICFYNEPPLSGEINLRSFQEIAAKRVAMLQFVDSRMDFRRKRTDGKMDHVSDIETKMEELGFMLPSPVFDKDDIERFLHIAQADVISHFILRLAFGKARAKREWFIRNEARLFEIRLDLLRNVRIRDVENQTKLEYFLQNQGIVYESLSIPHLIPNSRSNSEQMSQFQDLIRFRNDAAKVEKIYIAPFYPDAISLVRHRQVLLKNGEAYVPDTVLHVLCASRFRQQIQNSLRHLDEAGTIDSAKPFLDERISAFLRVLPESYLAVDYSRSSFVSGRDHNLSLANINSVFQRTFPPCMRRIFTHYVRSRHLKHNARRQFWLFLKGCGMTLEENIHFNRNIWSDAGAFDKEHVYNIRHIYGKEGRRLSYPPLSCNSIIRSLPPPTAGQVHGCPFKDLDMSSMRNMLEEFGLSGEQISPIMDLKSTHQYQLACVEYFSQTTPTGSMDGVGIHPNVFFQNSFKAHYSDSGTSG
ncbi:DNA primase large subunit [Babesia sp. Xinjiang]|uniref:DNA primase large subunit n=1 Tax=Babesia sp. Xinjiang TaxID=462227 RepID=UPI000A21ADE1|nr:DNA primase large subunit [Babesia sp. Xinjiang]ORM41301.1 DNA primase large subunit [Babesia sp. Xinjiang]